MRIFLRLEFFAVNYFARSLGNGECAQAENRYVRAQISNVALFFKNKCYNRNAEIFG